MTHHSPCEGDCRTFYDVKLSQITNVSLQRPELCGMTLLGGGTGNRGPSVVGLLMKSVVVDRAS